MQNNSGSDSTALADTAVAQVVGQGMALDGMSIHGRFDVQCFDKDGNLKWEDTIDNTVMTLGKNEILDKFYAGSAYTAALYMGLISSVSYASVPVVGDTQSSHATWTECGATNAPNYSSGTRVAVAWNAAAAGSKASTATSFTFSNGGTVKGCLISTNNTKDGTTGILVSAGLFTGGDRVVVNTDVLNVTYTSTLT